MEIHSISDFRRAVRNGPYAWPGGYPCYWIMADGGSLAFSVAKSDRRQMLEALAEYTAEPIPYRARRDNEWRPVALEINWEDGDLYCDHTGKRIESAYAEPEDAPAPLEYFINLDERGDFYADVRRDDSTIFEIHGFDIFEDGFMCHKTDTTGLLDYLVSLGIAHRGETIARGN